MKLVDVQFDRKTRKFVLKGPFQTVDLMRSFPSRRFDPKSKTWRMPLTPANVRHFNSPGVHGWCEFSEDALRAMSDIDRLTAPPVHSPFPHAYFADKPFEPLPHQIPMLDYGWNIPHYALFAAPGTGKTFIKICHMMARFELSMVKRVSIITLETLHKVWEKEFVKWTVPYQRQRFSIRKAKTGDKGAIKWYEECRKNNILPVYLISVEGLGISPKYYDHVLQYFTHEDVKTEVVCDESVMIKNPDAARTQRSILIGNSAGYNNILNGTPSAKGYEDFWSQYEFMDPNIIGSGDYWAFKTEYIVQGGYENKQIVGYRNIDQLVKLIAPYTLTVTKDVLNLPEKLYKIHEIEPSAEQKQLFRAIIKGRYEENQTVKVDNVLERMLRLKQVASGYYPQMVIHWVKDDEGREVPVETTDLIPLKDDPKLEDLKQTIELLKDGSKFIIWSSMSCDILKIRDFLATKYGPSSVATYFGPDSMEDRNTAETRYCNDPTLRFVVANPQAASLGLTFISGEQDIYYYYSGTNNYVHRTQSEDRSHRIGQKNNLVIIDAVMRESVVDVLNQESIAHKLDLDTYIKRETQGVQFQEFLEKMYDKQVSVLD